jgi:hypothetical protein
VLNVDITNTTKEEKMVDYPFTVTITDRSSSENNASARTLEFRTDKSGTFAGDINAQSGKNLSIKVNYRGIIYRSQTVEVKNRADYFSLPVPVYDISDRKENIAITERFVTLVPRNERVVQVYEHLKVENRGNTTYVGRFNDELDLTQVLHIPLPSGYVLNGLQGIPYPMTYTLSNALVSKEDIKPGTHTLSINYQVISDTGFFDLSLFGQKDAPEIRSLSLYFPQDKSWKIKLSGLKPAGEKVMGNRTFNIWKGTANDVMHIKLYGPTYKRASLLWAISIILLFVVTLAVLYMCRVPVRLWYMKREKNRLESMLSAAREEASETGTGEFYRPFMRIISARLKEIDEGLGT